MYVESCGFKQVYVSIDRNTVLEIMSYFSYQVNKTGISNIGRSKSRYPVMELFDRRLWIWEVT